MHTFEVKADRLRIFQGLKNGFCQNFLSLICDSSIKADLSDQDDIWHEDKLSRAVKVLSDISYETPALYCSRTKLVNERNIEIGLSPLFRCTPEFRNALVQNIGSGNTMVFNHAARRLMLEVGSGINPVVHDWFLYMVISGCGGVVIYDLGPSLRYRQHAANLIGEKVDLLPDSGVLV